MRITLGFGIILGIAALLAGVLIPQTASAQTATEEELKLLRIHSNNGWSPDSEIGAIGLLLIRADRADLLELPPTEAAMEVAREGETELLSQMLQSIYVSVADDESLETYLAIAQSLPPKDMARGDLHRSTRDRVAEGVFSYCDVDSIVEFNSYGIVPAAKVLSNALNRAVAADCVYVLEHYWPELGRVFSSGNIPDTLKRHDSIEQLASELASRAVAADASESLEFLLDHGATLSRGVGDRPGSEERRIRQSQNRDLGRVLLEDDRSGKELPSVFDLKFSGGS